MVYLPPPRWQRLASCREPPTFAHDGPAADPSLSMTLPDLPLVHAVISVQAPGAPPMSRPLEPPIFFPPAPTPSGTPSAPASRPGCFAYPDMLEVGQMEGSGQASEAQSADESACGSARRSRQMTEARTF